LKAETLLRYFAAFFSALKYSSGMLDMEWWRREANWSELLKDGEVGEETSLRGCTYAGRPFGEESFVSDLAKKFGRYWTRGRPKKEGSPGKERTDAPERENAAPAVYALLKVKSEATQIKSHSSGCPLFPPGRYITLEATNTTFD
jgi:hypothetical protein